MMGLMRMKLRDPVNLTPSFVANRGPASGGYSASVGSAISMITLNVSSSHAGSVVTVMAEGTEPAGAATETPAEATDGEYSGDITLAASGATDIEVKVTAEDGVAEAKYMITVSKEAADAGVADATLKKLSVMVGSTELINGFPANPREYTGNVAAAASSVRVDAVASNSRADVEVTSDAGAVTGNGPYTARLNAAGQDTEITVIVTSANEVVTFTSTITITRAGSSDSRQVTLNSLTVTGTTISSMMPAFVPDAAPAANGYVVYVEPDVDMVTVTAGATHSSATVAITPDADDATPGTATITLATDGDNETEIMVKVTAQDGFATATYTINVMKVEGASITDTLSSLSLTAGGDNLTLMPAFIPDAAPGDDDGYVVDVSAATSSVVVNATTSHTGATVKTSSGTRTGDGVNDRFTLKAAGMDTEIKVEVTAQDKATTLAYMITVTRASSTASTDADLRSLELTMDDGADADELRGPR